MLIKDKKTLIKLTEYGVLDAKDVSRDSYSEDEPNVFADEFGNLQKVDAEHLTEDELNMLISLKQLEGIKKANSKLTFLVVVGIIYLLPIAFLLITMMFGQ